MWEAIKEGKDDAGKTKNLIKLLLVARIPTLLFAVAIGAAVVLWALR